jgi:L-threonylcarbamoyladenylate synthase
MDAGLEINFRKEAPPHRGASSFVFPPSKANLHFFSNALKRGNLVAIPTETVYGLAALATDPKACRAIFKIKGRPLIDPLITHINGSAMGNELAVWNKAADTLADAFWPGPLSLILPKKKIVPDIVSAGKSSVALRCPAHPVAQALIDISGPLAAPSANPFGYISPTLAGHVADSFGSKVRYIIDGGPCQVGLESTILDIRDPRRVVLLRPGAISGESIAEALGQDIERQSLNEDTNSPQLAPGNLASHYSPNTPLKLFEGPFNAHLKDSECIIYLSVPPPEKRTANAFWFSETGQPDDIAKSLFTLLRNLDKKGCGCIYAEAPGPEAKGILLAVRDRLLRAAAPRL